MSGNLAIQYAATKNSDITVVIAAPFWLNKGIAKKFKAILITALCIVAFAVIFSFPSGILRQYVIDPPTIAPINATAKIWEYLLPPYIPFLP